MTSIQLGIIGAVLLLVAFVLPLFLRHAVRLKQDRLEIITKFYEIAPKVVSDQRLPHNLAILLHMISCDIDSRRVVYGMIRSWLSGEMGSRRYYRQQAKFAEDLQNLPEDLRTKFLISLAVGVICVTYAAPLAGAVLRRLLLSPVGMPDNTDEAPRFALVLGEHCPTHA